MSIVFIMAPVALLLAGLAVASFIWATRDGQFEDTETPAHRMLFDEIDSPAQDNPAEGPQRNSLLPVLEDQEK